MPEDMKSFLDYAQRQDPVVITLKASDSPEVTPVPDPLTESRVITLWNKRLLGTLERKLIKRPGGNDYYRIDDSLPTLELSPSQRREWNGAPALLQGRVYGFFDKPFLGYEEWYDSLARFIRANFRKSSLKLLGGYIGPQAFKWFQNGGALLPMFEPPPTSEWMSFVQSQHSVDSSTPK